MRVMIRHTRFLPTLLLLITTLFSSNLAHARWVNIKPTGGKKAVIQIAGRQRTFHRLSPGQSMIYNLTNITQLRIDTRVDFYGRQSSEEVYTFRLAPDNADGVLYARASIRESTVTYKDQENRIGEVRTLIVDFPLGSETLTVSLDPEAPRPVFFRAMQERASAKAGITWIAIDPVQYPESVHLLSRDDVLDYYTIDEQGLLTFQCNGPAQVRVLARAMLDETMRGRYSFPVTVYEDGIQKANHSFSTSFSRVAEIIDRPDLRPSRGEEFYIEVPRGRHDYTFSTYENGAQVILRFFLGEADLRRTSD